MGSYVSYIKAALTSQVNIVVMSGVAIFSLLLMSPVLLLAGAAAEAVWLLGAPMLPPFRASVQRRADKHRRIDSEAALRKTRESLHPANQTRFDQMAALAGRIRATIAGAGETERALFERTESNLDTALARFASMLAARDSYRRVLEAGGEDELAARLVSLDAELAGADEELRRVKQRQRDIIEKRIEKLRIARKNQELLGAHIEALEDLMRLLLEQATTMADPAGVTAQIDELLADADTAQRALDDIRDAFGSFDRELAAVQDKNSAARIQ